MVDFPVGSRFPRDRKRKGMPLDMKKLITCALVVFLAGGVAMGKGRSAAKTAKSVKRDVAITRTDSSPISQTGNISKVRREQLLSEVAAIKSFLERSAGTDTNAVRLLSFVAELEKEVRGKKYGLVFEEHRERVDVELDENIPVLQEVKGRFLATRNAKRAKDGGTARVVAEVPLNFLIEGDNLAALKLLEKTHRGRIDLIYIDPPYNTGNKDFIYNDSYVDKTDTFHHSKWLSFMKKRLEIAKRLMSDKGVIFISIDDNEQAALRLLCDDEFGEANFLGQLTWESTTQPINAGKARFQLQQKTEYIMCYAKNRHKKDSFRLRKRDITSKYPHKGKFGSCRFEIIEKSDAGAYRRDSMKFAILGQYPRKGKRWQIGETEARRLEREGKVELVNGIVKKAVYPEDEHDKESFIPFWSHLAATDVGTAQNRKEELNDIFGEEIGFDTVKPTKLLCELLLHFDNNVSVLDFFAGSGTTGHAVMKLNAEDGGRRRFILVTNNENGICEKVTYERLKRVMAKEKYAARLKYYKVSFVPITEDGYWERADALLGYIRELVELENGIDFSHDTSVEIVLTDEELGRFVKRLAKMGGSCGVTAPPRILYKGHNVILGAKAKAAIEKHGVEVKTIPDYYYPELED